MNIAVCINQVPDTASRIEVVDGKIDRSRLSMVMNPYDEYALEEAIQLKEHDPESTVTVFSAGEQGRTAVLRKALAFGADSAVLACGEEPADSSQAADMLVQAIRHVYDGKLPDLVLCGRESTDRNRGEVPLLVAGMLEIGAATRIVSLERSGGELTLRREVEGGAEVLTGRMPFLVSAEKGLNTPRKTSIKNVMKAKKKKIEQIDVEPAVSRGVDVRELEPVDRTRSCRMLESVEELAAVFDDALGDR
ncbi:electron transfer flavoprotein beta subunit/FixA family protein [Prosthecochloris sp. ZM_2]|uniref:electron transfer flavoprotein subunit beta/FixA family protein n=1 Tax=Prosthecochloris sp. ZM_2 TaxID=2045206 RepID=UPI000DF79A31|nr:electron transfer flavoprotein subunit beta/FixA family protein [Prosthecochloris sp. ZM_2]RNA71432.1 electron transfer flavoprotein beta subunit/FixA family protein [Prosthecochloris sp. ZM_2]